MENMPEENKTEDNNEVLIELMRENLKTSREVLRLGVYIKKYIVFQKIFFWFKLVLILVPVILAIVYLPPFLKGAFSSFQDLTGSFGIINENSALIENYKK
jgi:hypothetical protein